MPTWSGGRDKDRDGDDGLLRPITRETTRSRWGSDSTGLDGSRKGSLFDPPEQERLGPIRRQEIQSPEDLERVKKRRKQGEEYAIVLSAVGAASMHDILTVMQVSTVCAGFYWNVGHGCYASVGLHLLQST